MTGSASVAHAGAPSTASPGPVLVIGYGNPLRADDGVGWAVAGRAAIDPRLRGADVRALHQLAPELAQDISRAALVVLVDADAAIPPGAVAISRLDARGPEAASWSHHVSPASLVALARELWDAVSPVFVVHVGAATLEEGEGLSAAVEAAVPRAVDAVAAIVGQHGGA